MALSLIDDLINSEKAMARDRGRNGISILDATTSINVVPVHLGSP